jgi:flavodoxin
MARILIVYFSQTGNTRKMAELVAKGAAESGDHDVTLVEVREFDLDTLPSFDAFALGSPDYYTYMAGEMKTLFDRSLARVPDLKGKPFVSFVSHGGGGGAIESLQKLGAAIGLRSVCDGLTCEGAPAKQSAEACVKLGLTLAEACG